MKDKNYLSIGIMVSLLLTVIVYTLGGLLQDVPHLADQGASWYFWKLPSAEFWPRVTAWGFYLIHQVTAWYFIYRLKEQKITDQPTRLNLYFMVTTVFFVLLHILQTHIWYDGLAQDVSIWTSQGSVVMMLVLILIMENRRRGLFFGKKVALPRDSSQWIQSMHAYLFSWAIIYTFWYHPMEGTSGHLIGFFYLFLLMLQMTLGKTKVHFHPYWTFTLETLVLLHGTLVALMQGNNMAPMFFFGFGLILIVTQLYGLKLPKLQMRIIQGLYILLAIIVYSGLFNLFDKNIGDVNEIIRIPAIEYLLVFLIAFGAQIPFGIKKVKKG